MCDKLAYHSEQSAIRQGRKKGQHCGGRVRAYRCPKCDHWHTTTKDRESKLGGIGANQ